MSRRAAWIWSSFCCAGAVAQEPSPTPPEAPQPTTAASPVFGERAARREAFRNDKVTSAVRAGIAWLIAHQDAEGGWSCAKFDVHDPAGARCDGAGGSYDIGVTALALLALLAQADPIHAEACHKAADWLCSVTADNGRVRSESQHWVYEQALTTLALGEATALLGVARHRTTAAAALAALDAHRIPGGSWRYTRTEKEGDISATSWCLAAYGACFHAGLEVPTVSIGEALAWIDSATDFESGRTGYQRRGEGAARRAELFEKFPARCVDSTTAAALHARWAVGSLLPTVRTDASIERMLELPPSWSEKSIDFYYWLQGSLALGGRVGSSQQRKWDAAVQAALLPNQRKDGSFKGSWDPVDAWGPDGGRVYATAANVLSLSAPYRTGDPSALALIPDAVPLRKLHATWKEGRIGAAAKMLDDIRGDTWTDATRPAQRAIRWFLAVHEAWAHATMAKIEAVCPDVLERSDRLKELERLLAPSPVANEATKALETLRADPAAKRELAAAGDLRALRKSYDSALASKNKSQRKQMQEQLGKLLTRHAGTKVAATVREMIEQLK